MTITNKHVGYFIWFAIVAICTYAVWPIRFNMDHGPVHNMLSFGVVAHHLIVLLVLIFMLIEGDIEFKIYIPNPFKGIADAYRQKQLYAKELNSVYEKMALAESNKELDFLIAKKEYLEDALGVGLARLKDVPPEVTKYLPK